MVNSPNSSGGMFDRTSSSPGSSQTSAGSRSAASTSPSSSPSSPVPVSSPFSLSSPPKQPATVATAPVVTSPTNRRRVVTCWMVFHSEPIHQRACCRFDTPSNNTEHLKIIIILVRLEFNTYLASFQSEAAETGHPAETVDRRGRRAPRRRFDPVLGFLPAGTTSCIRTAADSRRVPRRAGRTGPSTTATGS